VVKNAQNRVSINIELTVAILGWQNFWQCVQIITLWVCWRSCRTFVRKSKQVKTVIF